MKYAVERTPEFNEWLNDQAAKIQGQVIDRLDKIAEHGHFGQYGNGWKTLTDELAELKWKSGLRVYFSIRKEPKAMVIVLCGGNKNGQDKDIKRAEKILGRLTV